MKQLIKKILPKFILYFYHYLKAYLAAIIYMFPSSKLIIIGVTGTKGKSSSANFVWAGLTGAGIKTGLLSTANFRIGDEEFLNRYHMTMPSPLVIQKMLRQMVNNNCKAAIIEITSEGIIQSRHRGINYDILVFTNLTAEHIASHGTFANYRLAKQKVFKLLNKQKRKTILQRLIPKTIIANADSGEVNNFIKFEADKTFTFSIINPADVRAVSIKESIEGVSFTINNNDVNLRIAGKFNVLNALPAIIIGEVLKLNSEDVIKGLENLIKIPGRMEIIQSSPFMVIVDYAHEKESLNALLDSIEAINKFGKIILLIGGEGGGRDKSKRAIMGEIAGKRADYLVVSNVDPYEEAPGIIINEISEGAKSAGMKIDKNLFLIENRKEGIRKALSLANLGDFVLITGKGSEQSMIIGADKIPWDDRIITKEILSEKKK
ncbi:MAG: UDP-N-acetylmuramyl-tripeptide synthetase [bacterium]|nr:UDP-N-acetylmuramyl-tripeptide synthetase [bacterium]